MKEETGMKEEKIDEGKKGLSTKEVEERVEAGLVNTNCDMASKTMKEIIAGNLFTFFNGLNVVLAVCVAMVHSFRNTLFLGVVFWNALIGIVQEIRAKRVLDRMAILQEGKVFVWRDGRRVEKTSTEIVQDDWIEFHAGEQICADAQVLEGCCEVDESMLTGESDAVEKVSGDKLFSGSYLLSGMVMARVVSVGKDSYANQLVQQAKASKKTKSEIRDSLDKIIKILSLFVVPLGIAMFVKEYFFLQLGLKSAVVKTVASIINMIPDGLVLLSSVVMAVSVIKLAKQKAIVQGLFSIENLARVDVLCLDKTGTITQGTMELIDEIVLEEEGLTDRICAYLTAIDEDTSTSEAIREKYANIVKWKTKQLVSFSSKRKWGAVEFVEEGTFVLGAPEMVLGDAYKGYKQKVVKYLERGERVLVFAKLEEGNIKTEKLQRLQVLSFFVLRDNIRPHVKETLDYFQEQGVRLVLISGDNPEAVMQIGKRAGLADAENYVDARNLKTPEQIAIAAKRYTIFGRVTPEQKRELVQTLQKQGHTVAMTGDGVNDVLALKEADCSIVMGSGCDVARKTAKVVLENSDFATMPKILAEGRKAINNLERSAALFLTKTTFSILLLFLFLFVQISYPLIPIQMTLIGSLTIGAPAFLLTLEPNYNVVSGSFLKKVFENAVPTGILALMNIVVIVVATGQYNFSEAVVSTMTVVGVAFADLTLVLRLCRPWNWKKVSMVVVLLIGLLGSIFFADDIFMFVPIPAKGLVVLAIIIVIDVMVSILLQIGYSVKKYLKNRGGIGEYE